MARRKPKFSLLMWLVFSGISGGGITGYLKPNIPIVGPMIAKLTARGESVAADSGTLLNNSANSLLSTQPSASYGASTVSGQLASARRKDAAPAQ